MAKRNRAPRTHQSGAVAKPPAKPKAKTNSTIDATADYADLASQHRAMQGEATRLSNELNNVQVTLAKLAGAMEYLINRGAQTPEMMMSKQQQAPPQETRKETEKEAGEEKQ